MFSSKTGNGATPQDFFDKLNWRFGPFNLNPVLAHTIQSVPISLLKQTTV